MASNRNWGNTLGLHRPPNCPNTQTTQNRSSSLSTPKVQVDRDPPWCEGQLCLKTTADNRGDVSRSPRNEVAPDRVSTAGRSAASRRGRKSAFDRQVFSSEPRSLSLSGLHEPWLPCEEPRGSSKDHPTTARSPCHPADFDRREAGRRLGCPSTWQTRTKIGRRLDRQRVMGSPFRGSGGQCRNPNDQCTAGPVLEQASRGRDISRSFAAGIYRSRLRAGRCRTDCRHAVAEYRQNRFPGASRYARPGHSRLGAWR